MSTEHVQLDFLEKETVRSLLGLSSHTRYEKPAR